MARKKATVVYPKNDTSNAPLSRTMGASEKANGDEMETMGQESNLSWVDQVELEMKEFPPLAHGQYFVFVADTGDGSTQPKLIRGQKKFSGSRGEGRSTTGDHSTPLNNSSKDNDTGQPERSWARLAKENRYTDRGTPLKAMERGDGEVRMVAEELYPMNDSWGYYAIGYFSG